MKIALISDVHIGPSGFYKGVRRKLTEYSEGYIREFLAHIASADDFAFAVQLGDMVQDVGYAQDTANFRRGLALFSRCPVPVHHLVGNHDTIHIPIDDIRGLLQHDPLYYAFDKGGFHFVLLHSHVPVAEEKVGVIDDRQLKWLEDDLSRTTFPTTVFVHYSPADQDLSGNPWFEGRPFACLIENRARVRDVVEHSGKVIAVINGHLHWNRAHIHGGIPYITIQSAIENFGNDGIPANSWGAMEITCEKLTLDIYGNDRASYAYNYSYFD